MVDPYTLLLGFVTDPRVGLPLLLLLAATVTWVVASPASEPRRHRGERVPPEPDADPVSRTYLALRREAYSSVLVETHVRLDRALFARTGRRLKDIPWLPSTAKRVGVPDPKGLRDSLRGLESLYLWSVRLETASLFRWDFWRSREASRAKFRTRLSERLQVVDRQLTRLGYAP
ncbi:MAG: hypothetical protein L3K01_04455 [Thermoplasmata archaeon]|nr:hypothetical protein [Thermoplasmata archaeon]